MKGPMAGPRIKKEQNMMRISKPDLYNKTERELDGLTEEFERALDVAEEERRVVEAVLQDMNWARCRARRHEP
jgi:hypothetical protein